jgi:hypothetical protein
MSYRTSAVKFRLDFRAVFAPDGANHYHYLYVAKGTESSDAQAARGVTARGGACVVVAMI